MCSLIVREDRKDGFTTIGSGLVYACVVWCFYSIFHYRFKR